MLFTIGLTLAFGIGLALWVLIASWLGPLCIPVMVIGVLAVDALGSRIASGSILPEVDQ